MGFQGKFLFNSSQLKPGGRDGLCQPPVLSKPINKPFGAALQPSPSSLQPENRLFVPFYSARLSGVKSRGCPPGLQGKEGRSSAPPGGKSTSRDVVVVMPRSVSPQEYRGSAGLPRHLPHLWGRDALARCPLHLQDTSETSVPFKNLVFAAGARATLHPNE